MIMKRFPTHLLVVSSSMIACADKWVKDAEPAILEGHYTRIEFYDTTKRSSHFTKDPVMLRIGKDKSVFCGVKKLWNDSIMAVDPATFWEIDRARVMSDTHAACMNFVNALEKIAGIIAQYEERTAKLKADVPQLEAIIAKPWGKEDELKALKSELAVLDRKITAELAPKHDEKEGEEVKHDEQTQHINHVDAPTQSTGTKETMVAEPGPHYTSSTNLQRTMHRSVSL